ncbi:MAG: PA14 domain-containing protein, partial [Candidatus Methylacidiphilales bacterium]
EAPKAFGQTSAGGMWLVYYSGYISPEESGQYKFSSTADNMIALYLDGRVASFGSTWGQGVIDKVKRMDNKEGWIRLKNDKAYFAEVFIADDGGNMHSRILVQRQGLEGTHIFQVGNTPEGLEDVLKQTGFKFGEVIFRRVTP